MPVTVNGEVVEDDLIQNEMKAMRPQLMKAMPDEPRSVIDQRAKDWARDNVVDQVLLRQAVSQDPEIVVRLTEKIAPPKQKEITEYYRKNRASLYRPESVKAVHVVSVIGETVDESAALGRIQEAERKISEGAAFESLEGYEI